MAPAGMLTTGGFPVVAWSDEGRFLGPNGFYDVRGLPESAFFTPEILRRLSRLDHPEQADFVRIVYDIHREYNA